VNPLLLIAICPMFFWDPATGADSYDIFMDGMPSEIWREGFPSATVPAESAIICAPDFYVEHAISVVGCNSAGCGPEGGALPVMWVWNMDIDGSGVVGHPDFRSHVERIRAQFGCRNNGIYIENCGP